MRVWMLGAIGIALAWTTPAALARPARPRAPAAIRRADPTRWPGARALPRSSRSMGYPWRGALRDGVRVVESDYLRFVDEYRQDGRFWGTWELVQLVERAAYRVGRRHPGAKLPVGELSKKEGGEVPGHSSHETGRDVDLGFYMLDAAGRPFPQKTFVHIRSDGTGRPPYQDLRFDDARNWELVAKLVADGDARVQYIFVARTLKRRLLREGERRGAPQVLLERARKVLIQPAGGHPHRNHFHVRIYCPPSSRPGCKDRPPFHPWSGVDH